MSVFDPGRGVATLRTYNFALGSAWVATDFEALAMTVTVRPGKSAYTEDCGQGVLIDRNEAGEIVAVEIIAGRSDLNTESSQS